MAASVDLYKEELILEVTRSLGYKDLKKEQKDAIMYFISSRDVFIALPTGFGKSLIYGCTMRGHFGFLSAPTFVSLLHKL